ncbi:hypothetical protein DMUE_2073 [Dictyocoela muelleri]|nr:hypothetical protein DMUE_2073 [Dictyocoela muelleri]
MDKIIYQNVLYGTIVITDEWKDYEKALRDMPKYEHNAASHSLNFVIPHDLIIHTQTIEGFWSLAKRYLRGKNGISQDQHDDFLIQFIWEHTLPVVKRFNNLLTLLRIKS